MKNSLATKLYYTISEVSELTQVQPYTLRTWEKEFPCLRPRRTRGKNRAYRERDIGIILLIKSLLYDERYTTQGVRQKLQNAPELLRQAASQGMALCRSWEARGARPELGEEKEEGIAASEREDAEAESPGGLGGKISKEVVEGVKQELREILRLL